MKSIKQFHTDEEYLSKEEFESLIEIKKKGLSWDDVLLYREKYSFYLPLINLKGQNTKIIQTPWILQKEIRMISEFSQKQATMLVDVSTRYASASLLYDISMKSFISEIHWLLTNNGKNQNISRRVIENLVNKSDEPKTDEEKEILKKYDLLEKITNELTMPKEIAKLFFNKKVILTPRLSDIYTTIIETIRSNKINSVLTKAASIIYGILGNDLFKKNSYEIMVLTLISISRNSYKGEILKGVSFFKTLDYFKPDLYKAVENAKNHDSDLTFVTLKLIKILTYSLRISNDQILTFIKDEERYNSLTTKDKNKSYKAILSSFPNLTKKQAEFYINHCDTKINYTLKDFQEYFDSSYETSRYSLDTLVEFGFYRKRKIGKKNIYNAIKQK